MKRRRTESHDDNANQMKLWDIVMIAGSLGLTLFVCICAGVALGRFIDSHAGTAPWGMIACSLIGAASGFLSLYKKAVRLNEDKSSRMEKDK